MTMRGVINAEAVFALCILALAAARSRPKTGAAPAAAGNPSSWADFAAVVSTAALIAVAFWRVRDLPFLSDDFILLRIGKDLSSQGYVRLFSSGGGDGFFRPLGLMSIGFTWPWAGTDTMRWHLVALALHFVNTALIYALARALSLQRVWAWFAAILFAVHAAHPEAVTWIAGRFDLVATAFSLSALTAFVLYWEQGSVAWGTTALLTMACGMLSKESAYAVPVMMTVYAASRTESWVRTVKRLAPFYGFTAALFGYRWAMQGGIGGYAIQLHPLSLVNALLVRIWAVLFFPVNWSEHAQWLFAAVILSAAGWLAAAWKPEGQRSRVLMLIGLTVTASLPAAGLLLIGADLEKARVLYLPSAAFCILAASMLQISTSRLRVAAAVVLLAFQLVALEHNLAIWQEVARTASASCEAAVRCSNPEAVIGLPRTLSGVYFFANGFPECVRLRQAEEQQTGLHECSMSWDAESKSIH